MSHWRWWCTDAIGGAATLARGGSALGPFFDDPLLRVPWWLCEGESIGGWPPGTSAPWYWDKLYWDPWGVCE